MSHDLQVRDAITRTLAAIGLAGVALIQVLDAHDTFVATPHKGWLYVGLIVGCLATAAVLVRRNDRRAWLARPCGSPRRYAGLGTHRARVGDHA